ncbi:MAG: hypothetical protein IT340_13445 [Chloroflexi bacterium]|nr:hypothetical protein [Chloroflexota bacterium]
MPRSRLAVLMILVCALFAGSLMQPSSASANPPVRFDDCRDITLAIYYVDEHGAGHQVYASPSAKRIVPVDTPLRFFLYIAPAKQGNAVQFTALNPFIQLNPGTVLEGGIITAQPDYTRFKIIWPGTASTDGQIVFESKVIQVGKLSTVGAQVAGGRCSTKIELVGRPRDTVTPCRIGATLADMREIEAFDC